MKWYSWDQNNSGGYYIESDNFGHIVNIEAECQEDAIKHMKKLGAFELQWCECCGERFDIAPKGPLDSPRIPYWEHSYEDDEFSVNHHADGRVIKVTKASLERST